MTEVNTSQLSDAESDATEPIYDVPPRWQREQLPIGDVLRQLRGSASIRDVQNGSGVSESYLSTIEHGTSQPGFIIIQKMADYHGISASDLIRRAETLRDRGEAFQKIRDADIERSYRFVLDDPLLDEYEKPTAPISPDAKRFIVQLYEHYTGRKLLRDEGQ